MLDRAVPAPAPRFALRVGAVGTTRVVTCSDELDIAAAPAIQEALYAAVDRRPECVLLDLSGLTFMDSSVIALMIRAHRQARTRGVRFAIVPAPDEANMVVRVCGLQDVLPFALTSEAVAA